MEPNSDKLLCTGRRKVFIIGFAAAIKSIIQITKNILLELCFKYLMTYRFSQDHLELFFAQVQRRHGWNNNSNVQQFKAAMKNLLVKNSISASMNANCIGFDATNDVLFKLAWTKKIFKIGMIILLMSSELDLGSVGEWSLKSCYRIISIEISIFHIEDNV